MLCNTMKVDILIEAHVGLVLSVQETDGKHLVMKMKRKLKSVKVKMALTGFLKVV